ncbi:unnamed protein product [Spirodela intermedia]|uniref:Cyclic nucleotide-binding domain-containing protein n=1 Tax=Spirodela intermedia TaxID=51605 RepID=A0A7I8IKJ7_SPIIN|nr:unnamed protein product [Spirodela intermedia]CAA6658411.1 unnamed protein product [Spirodela intermedia]
MAGRAALRSPHLHADDDEEDDPSTSGRCPDPADEEKGGGGGGTRRRGGGEFLWRLLDPHATSAREWNRVFLLVCAAALFVDPLFFYALSISGTCMCLFIDGWFAVSVTALRCMTDMLYVWNMWLQLKMAYYARRVHAKAEDEHIAAAGWRAALRRLKSVCSALFDLFVILPAPQVSSLRGAVGGGAGAAPAGWSTSVMTVFLVTFLAQYVPKVYHSFRLLRRMQNISGYIFGTIGWGVALNLICYFVVAHAAGACWYLLAIQRATRCLGEQCRAAAGCGSSFLACEEPMFYGTSSLVFDAGRAAWGGNSTARAMCLDSSDNYGYGAYEWAVPLVTNSSRVEKILLPIFWAIMSLSSFGQLSISTDWLEIVFNIVIMCSGLVLVTMLIGNIKVFLSGTSSKKQAMQLQLRNTEWWMRRRRLPESFRRRVRQYERRRWAAMRGVDEYEMIRDLPEGLRRDIKYHLCLDLVRQVPLFQHMDAVVLENICDRVRSLIFTKGETIAREGEPVKRMLFVVRGHLQSSQLLRDGMKSSCMLGRETSRGRRLPLSSSTLLTIETTEVFALEAGDVKYVTQHFRHTFVNDKVRRSARYYSPGWRTWAAVAIQLAWRRHRHRLTLSSMGEDKLRLYTAILTSPKPLLDDFPL